MHTFLLRSAALGLASVLLATLIGCAGDGRSESRSDSAASSMTYDDAVKTMRRPPTSARTTPEGDLVATWITEVRGGHKHLILTFGPDRVLKDHREEIR